MSAIGPMDQWLIQTEGGLAQIDDKSLLSKKPRSDIEKLSKLKTRKIRVYPANDEQKRILPKRFGTARWTYKQCIALIQIGIHKPDRNGGLREAVVNNDIYKEQKTWVLDTPRDVRAGALEDLINAYKSNFAKKTKKGDHTFKIQFRSRKVPQERIYINKRKYKSGVIYPRCLKKFPSDRLNLSAPLWITMPI